MDSKAINKLIRSEIWPILREQGFSVFETRNAFAYVGPFINVVNFQSFNSHLADGLGCTTYSFAVNLATYVVGSPDEERIRRDEAERMKPAEYQCSLRTVLKKRTMVEGFARSDIFYINPDGRTTAACFHEVQFLLREFAAIWFKAQNNLRGLLADMGRAERCEAAKISGTQVNPGSALWADLRSSDEVIFCRSLDYFSAPGSYYWNQTRSVLLLTLLKQDQTASYATNALDSIERLIGTILDFSTIQSGRPGEERYAIQLRELWEQLGQFQPIPTSSKHAENRDSCLDGIIWGPILEGNKLSFDSSDSPVAARKQLWPILKDHGFSEFTDRLAHRISKDLIEVVEFLPVDPFERKTWKLPNGLFRLGVGVFWPDLADSRLVRRNRQQEFRPIVNECHLSNWLAPEAPLGPKARMAFITAEDAVRAIVGPGVAWLDTLRDTESALSLLNRRDWELFWRYPMMRAYGAKSSSKRQVYIANLQRLLGKHAEAGEHLQRAEAAIPAWYNDHYGAMVKEWIEKIKPAFQAL